MNKRDLVRTVAKETGKPIIEIDAVVQSIFDTITKALESGETVSIGGFGSFALGARKTKKKADA